MGVSLNGGTPQNTPKCSCLVGKPMVMVVGYQHFKKHPHEYTQTVPQGNIQHFFFPKPKKH